MGNFNRYNRSDRGVRQMHRTTCSNCDRECEVPFKPTGSKPVFCSECFERNGGGQSRGFNGGDRDRAPRRPSFEPNRNFDRPQNNDRPQQNNEQFDALNVKLDKILAILAPKSANSAKASKIQDIEEVVIAPEEPVLVVKKRKSAPGKTTPLPTNE